MGTSWWTPGRRWMRPTVLTAALFGVIGCQLLVGGEELNDREWHEARSHAVVASSVGDYETAIEKLDDAYAIATSRRKYDVHRAEIHIVWALQQRAAIHATWAHYELCKLDASEALEYRERVPEPNAGLVANILADLSRCSILSGEIEQGMQFHDELVELHRPRAEPYDEFLASIHRAAGNALLEMDAIDAAIEQYEEALRVRLWSENSRRFDIALTLSGYAKALRKQGRADDAATAEQRAAAILEDSDYYREARARAFDIVQTWPDAPIKVHITRLGKGDHPRRRALKKVAHEAVLAWSDTVEPGVPAFEFVHSPARADIVIRWVDIKGKATWVGRTHLQFLPGAEVNRMKTPIDIGSTRLGVPVDLSEIDVVIRHEMGHALGIIGHSPYPNDLMYFSINRATGSREITERDRNTLQTLY